MKKTISFLGPVLALSAAAWAGLYLLYPEVPPGPNETLVIVGLALVAVAAVRALAGRLRRRERKAVKLRALAGALLLPASLSTAAPGAAAGPVPASGDPVLVCSADRPAAPTGDSVAARVFLSHGEAAGARVEWSASAGRVEGEGAAVVWHLSGPAPAEAVLTARVRTGSGPERSCAVSLLVLEPPTRGSARLAGRALLVRDSAEAPMYGLYSYLLIGAPASGAGRERHARVAGEYVRLVGDAMALEQMRPRERLNVTYAPVERRPRRFSADSLLASYDHERAQVLLAQLEHDGLQPDGVYLVSVRAPLSAATAAPRTALVMDLSAVPPEMAGLWVAEFINQTAQERFWESGGLRRVGLRLRTGLAVAGEALPRVRDALAQWIQWTSGGDDDDGDERS
jgi:hypothetical protein